MDCSALRIGRRAPANTPLNVIDRPGRGGSGEDRASSFSTRSLFGTSGGCSKLKRRWRRSKGQGAGRPALPFACECAMVRPLGVLSR
jgi:hypothetical protein